MEAPSDAEFHCASGDIKISFLTRMDLRTISLQRQYRSQACQANTNLDLGCIGQEPFRSGAAKPLQGQLASLRDKILLGHCVCRSFNNLHLQNWLAGPGAEVLCSMGFARILTQSALNFFPRHSDIMSIGSLPIKDWK